MGQPNIAELAASFRTLMLAVLLVIVMNVGAIVANASGANQNLMVALAILAVGLVVGVFLLIQVIKTTRAMGWSTGAMVACGIAMFIPCVSLIVLIVINQAAVKMLKANGYKVTLMDATK